MHQLSPAVDSTTKAANFPLVTPLQRKYSELGRTTPVDVSSEPLLMFELNMCVGAIFALCANVRVVVGVGYRKSGAFLRLSEPVLPTRPHPLTRIKISRP